MLYMLVCAVVLVSAPSQLVPLAAMRLPALKDEVQARGQKLATAWKKELVERLALLRELGAPDVGRVFFYLDAFYSETCFHIGSDGKERRGDQRPHHAAHCVFEEVGG